MMWSEVQKSNLSSWYVNITEGDMGGGGGSGKSDKVATVEAFKEKEKEIMAMRPQKEKFINKPEPKAKFRVFSVQEILFLRSCEEISIGEGHPGSHSYPLNLKVMEQLKKKLLCVR